MRDLLSLQLRLVPDLLEVMQKRLSILRNIYLQQPIGRRSLAASLNTTERILRGEVDFLKEQGLVHVESIGMFLTDTGLQILESLEKVMKDIYGLSELEAKVKQLLNINQIIVVPGRSDESELDKRELGRMAANYLLSVIREKDVVAVTGGSTLAMMAEMMSESRQLPDVLFVPARGGLGQHVEFQANQVAAACAKKVGAKYQMLHISDFVGESVYHSLREDPHIREMLTVIRSARVVVHGIGRAVEMAIRRNASSEVLKKLEQGQAVGEAFGYYFNKAGEVVYRMETMGLQLDDVKKARQVIGVAGGAHKAEAIYAIARIGLVDTLIMDEAAAEAILSMKG